jgi:hypothetical protein
MLPHDGNAINNGCVLFTTCRTTFSGRISAAPQHDPVTKKNRCGTAAHHRRMLGSMSRSAASMCQ